MLKCLIANRLKIEFSYYVLVRDLMTFREKWCVGEILCCIYEEQLVLKKDCCCKCVFGFTFD